VDLKFFKGRNVLQIFRSSFFEPKKWLYHIRKGFAKRAVFCTSSPHPQNLIDIFPDLWWTNFDKFGVKTNAHSDLYNDERLNWLLSKVSPLNLNILEFGPLEAAHTCRLEKEGAQSITAVEASEQSYLKCLLVKELAELTRSRFLYGDALEFLRQLSTSPYKVPNPDLILACGILYHLVEPIEFLQNCLRLSPRLYLWTHYYDEERATPDMIWVRNNSGSTTKDVGGKSYKLYRQNYFSSTFSRHFSGGIKHYSLWLDREGLMRLFQEEGFTVEVHRDELTPVGPAISLLASR
jgi:hypothetical protein